MNEREIFEKALDLSDRDARAAFLDVACGGDREMRDRVDALLQSHEEAGSFLKGPAHANSPTVDLAPSIALGTKVGPYKLLQRARRRRHGRGLHGRADRAGGATCGGQDHQSRAWTRVR